MYASNNSTTPSGLLPAAVEAMMTRLLLTPLVFQEVRAVLRPELFTANEQHLQTLWMAMLRVWDQYGAFSYHTLRDTCMMLLNEQRRTLPPMVFGALFDEPQGLLYWTFHVGNVPENSVERMARDLVRQFIGERYVFGPLRTAVATANPADPKQVTELLATAQTRQRELQAVDIMPVASVVPTSWDETARDLESTGLAYLDVWMDGGDAPGEIYGIIGPTGGGKTMLGVTLSVAKARVKQGLYDDLAMRGIEPPPRPIVYYVSYEQGLKELQSRFLANASMIPTSTLASLRDPEASLSSAARGDWRAYELEMFQERYPNADPHIVRPGELERLREAVALLEDGVSFVDLSGLDPEKSRPGTGFVDEIRALITIDQERRGKPGVALIVVDYALLAATRYLGTQKNSDSAALRHAIVRFNDDLRTQVASVLNTPIWILQQANTKGNTSRVADGNRLASAAESFGFNQPLAFCVALGNKDLTTNCVVLSFEKRRRTGDVMPPTVVFINGRFAMMEDGSDRFMISQTLNAIVPIAMGRAVHAAQAHQQLTHGIDMNNPAAAAAGFM